MLATFPAIVIEAVPAPPSEAWASPTVNHTRPGSGAAAWVRTPPEVAVERSVDAVWEATNRVLDLGLDSLMALELRRLLAAGSGLAEDALSATLVFDYPTVGALVAQLGSQLQAEDAPPVSQPAQDGGASTGHPVPAA